MYACCTNHTRRATFFCNQYPCMEVSLCDECKEPHRAYHAKKKLWYLDEHLSSCVKLRAKIEKVLDRSRLVLEKVKSVFTPKEMADLRDKLRTTEEAMSFLNGVFGRIEKLRKVYSGEAKPDPEEMKVNFVFMQKNMENNFWGIIQEWRNLLEKRFFQLLSEVKDFRSVFMFYDPYMDLVVNNTQVGIFHRIELRRHEVKSCNILDGPSLQRCDNKAYLIGGYECDVGATDLLIEVEFRGRGFIVRHLPKMIHARYGIGSALVKKSVIYAVTGTIKPADHEIHVKYNERYDIAARKWVSLSQVNEARAAPGMCAINCRYIYIYGGLMDGNVSSCTLEVYDTLDDERGWKIIKALEAAREVNIGICVTAIQAQISDNEYMLVHSNKLFIMSAVGESARVKTRSSFDLSCSLYYLPMWLEDHILSFGTGKYCNKDVYNLITHEFSESIY